MPQTTLRPHPSSAGAARRFVADVLLNRGFADDCIERATLLTSEVVTSAVVRLGTGVELVVLADHPMVRVEVHEDEISPSQDSEPGEATNLRLRLIDAFSEAWGIQDLGSRGSRIWFEVRADDRLPLASFGYGL